MGYFFEIINSSSYLINKIFSFYKELIDFDPSDFNRYSYYMGMTVLQT